MRTHRQIVKAFGAAALVRGLAERGFKLGASTPHRWSDRDSIPAEYWSALAAMGAASLDELARGAEREVLASGVSEEAETFTPAPSLAPAPFETPLIYPARAKTPEARRAALDRLFALADQGWRSDGRKMTRDEMHER